VSTGVEILEASTKKKSEVIEAVLKMELQLVLATWVAEIGRIEIKATPGKQFSRLPSTK
jgi:hypothetical protein